MPFTHRLTIDNYAIGIHKTGFAKTDALNLRSRQHYACRIGLNKEILE